MSETVIKNGLIISGSTSTSGSITATTYYGDGSNLTGISGTTINNNTNNYVITATGTANTLNGEANLQFNGSTLTVTGNVSATAFTGSLFGTSSYATQALSASYAPGGDAFPYTGSAEITGSLTVRGASLVQDGSLGVVSTGTTNATEAFKVQNATPEDLLVVRDDGEIVVNTTKYSLNGILTNNGGIITEVNGYNGIVVIQQPTPDPPITLDIQNGLIINVL